MAIDISKFHQTFFEESLEGLEAMEHGLLQMEGGVEDDEAINTIFRAAHSIKGGAGTLGFGAMADFTHHLETILDRRRSNRGELGADGVDVLLASVDCLREMLGALQDGRELDSDRIAEVEARLQELVDRGEDESAGDTARESAGDTAREAADGTATDAAEDTTADAAPGWRITFAPGPDMLRTGNDPVRLLGELTAFGRCAISVELGDLPALEDLDVEVCHLRWTIDLGPGDDGTVVERTRIDEVFEWVEDEADIVVVPLTRPDAGPAAGAVDETTSPDQTDRATPAPADVSTPADHRRGGERRRDRSQPPAASSASSIRVDTEKVDTLINLVGELVITQSMLQQLAINGDELELDRLLEGLGELEGHTRELQSSVMQIRMIPISFAFSRLPRLVRDLASKLGKHIDLQISGETTELDKTVMEKISDPLVHLIRNSVDHGIEMPDERRAGGKDETGTVSVGAYHEGGNIIVEIADDGAGLQPDRILAKARERGLVGDDEVISEKQINELIFSPGFSTAAQVSDISGRGVGMDVVRRNINDLGGVIEVESQPGQGTTFRIRLPLTLAILDGQLVRVGDQVFIIPLISIVESLQLDDELVGGITNSASVYRHRDVLVPLIDLRETFGVEAAGQPEDPLLVVVDADGARAGLVVDDLLAQQQIVIKSLTTNFRAVPGLSGATILGDGTVAMIVDVNGVLNLFQLAVPSPNPVPNPVSATVGPAAESDAEETSTCSHN